MLSIFEFLPIWGFFGVNILSPGPNVLNTISTAMGSGRRAGLACAGAVAVGVTCWSLSAVLGVAVLFELFPFAEVALTLVGAALLIWFASRYLRRAFFATYRVTALKGITARRAFFSSLGILLTNPKAMTTWLVILSVFPVAEASTRDLATLVAGAVVVAVAGHATYAMLFSTRAAAAAYTKVAPVVNGIVGVFFLSVAAKLILGVVAKLSA